MSKRSVEYDYLDAIIRQRAKSDEKAEEMIGRIAEHLNGERNYDLLTEEEQLCLVIWENDCSERIDDGH